MCVWPLCTCVLHVVKFYDPYSRCFLFRQIHKLTRSCDGVCDSKSSVMKPCRVFSFRHNFRLFLLHVAVFPHDPFIEGLILSDEMTSVLFNRWPFHRNTTFWHIFCQKFPSPEIFSVPSMRRTELLLSEFSPSDQISIVLKI